MNGPEAPAILYGDELSQFSAGSPNDIRLFYHFYF